MSDEIQEVVITEELNTNWFTLHKNPKPKANNTKTQSNQPTNQICFKITSKKLLDNYFYNIDEEHLKNSKFFEKMPKSSWQYQTMENSEVKNKINFTKFSHMFCSM